MKKIIALMITFITITGFCFATDPVEGYWLSIDDQNGEVTAGWRIYQEGGRLFGMILSMTAYSKDVLAQNCRDSYQDFPVTGIVSQMPVVGTPWIFGLTHNKTGEWSGGNIINPENGRMYRCRITFHPAAVRRFPTDTLEVRGEVGMGIGRSQYWRRTDRQTAESLGP